MTPPTHPLSRELIIATARRMIAEHGLDALSLRGVGTSLGVTAPALYAYVTDKRDLLAGVAGGEFEHLIKRFEAIDAADPVDRMRCYSRAYIDYALENPELFRTMFLFPPGAVMAGAGSELPVASRAFEVPLEAVREAVAAGCLRTDTDPLMAALTLWTATHGAATVLLLGVALDQALADRLVTEVLDAVILGLCR